MMPLAPWVPNPADIEDGQFLQWNAATGRFEAVDAPSSGSEIQAINCPNSDLPYQFQTSSPGSPPNFNFNMAAGLAGDRYLLQCIGTIQNQDVVNPAEIQAGLLLAGATILTTTQSIANTEIIPVVIMAIGELVADDPAPNISVQFSSSGPTVVMSSATLLAIKLPAAP